MAATAGQFARPRERREYDNVRIGMNSRLDTLRAAILLEKLAIYAEEIDARNRIAECYNKALHNLFVVPHVPGRMRSIWAQYTLRASNRGARDVASRLKEQGIPCGVTIRALFIVKASTPLSRPT